MCVSALNCNEAFRGNAMTWQRSPRRQIGKISLQNQGSIKWGRIVMSPANNRHGRRQFRIGTLLEKEMSGGEAITECSVDTPLGTKVAGMGLGCLYSKIRLTHPILAPEICVEVKSLSNTRPRWLRKSCCSYLEAHEVWICDKEGNITFHDHTGQIPQSRWLRRFP